VSSGGAIAVEAGAVRRLPFEFRGDGLEFFRIWIVNISLTLLTLGIYSAWARVRTKRYFYGNTYIDGHSFDYHAAPWRILIGRMIAVLLLVAYNVTVALNPLYSLAWFGVFVFGLPWLINSSLRFNARNTSFRNVRFNFTGKYGGSFAAHVGWPIAGFVTVGLLIPLARRARDYFHINNHTYGGTPFRTEYKAWKIYGIYILAIVVLVAIVTAIMQGLAYLYTHGTLGPQAGPNSTADSAPSLWMIFLVSYTVIGLVWFMINSLIDTMVFNLSLGNTKIDERHGIEARLSPLTIIWIKVTNLILVLLTVGLLYPWAKVRLARYHAKRMALLATSDLSEFTSELVEGQSAIGEQIGSVFDVDLGL
jgi:uncharacterized membrane protein YjgN (DUF898 family)